MIFPPKISRSFPSGPYPGYKGSHLLIGWVTKLACNFTTKAHGYITWLTYLQNLLIWVPDFVEAGRVLCLLLKLTYCSHGQVLQGDFSTVGIGGRVLWRWTTMNRKHYWFLVVNLIHNSLPLILNLSSQNFFLMLFLGPQYDAPDSIQGPNSNQPCSTKIRSNIQRTRIHEWTSWKVDDSWRFWFRKDLELTFLYKLEFAL